MIQQWDVSERSHNKHFRFESVVSLKSIGGEGVDRRTVLLPDVRSFYLSKPTPGRLTRSFEAPTDPGFGVGELIRGGKRRGGSY